MPKFQGSRTCHAWRYRQHGSLSWRIQGHIFRMLWPGADQAHIPFYHVPELREFIKFGSPQDRAHAGDPAVSHGGDGRPFLLGVHSHGTEFQDLKLAAKLSDALLSKQHRPGGAELDGYRDDKKKRKQ